MESQPSRFENFQGRILADVDGIACDHDIQAAVLTTGAKIYLCFLCIFLLSEVVKGKPEIQCLKLSSIWEQLSRPLQELRISEVSKDQKCADFGWDRVNFLHSSWDGAMFWICAENSVDNRGML